MNCLIGNFLSNKSLIDFLLFTVVFCQYGIISNDDNSNDSNNTLRLQNSP